jgi:hypothetical protein
VVVKRPGNFATGTREPLSGVRHANDYFAVDLIDVDFRDLPRGREAKNPLVELGAVHARKLPSEFPEKTTCSTHFAGDPDISMQSYLTTSEIPIISSDLFKTQNIITDKAPHSITISTSNNYKIRTMSI